MSKVPTTLIEVAPFSTRAREIWSEEEIEVLKDYLARNPTAGDLIRKAGGVRKLRWAIRGRGKSGGARVIYYYHPDEMPLFLLTAYAKNVQADLTMAQKHSMADLVKVLATHYRRKR